MRVLCALFVFFACAKLPAETDDSDFPLGPTRVSFDFAPWCQIGDHKFIFESITLSDVIRILGAGTIRPNPVPMAGDYTYFVDYTDGKNLISFLSDSDLGGERHDLEGILIMALPDKEKLHKIPWLSVPVVLPFGAPEPKLSFLKQKLGAVTVQKGRIYYEFIGTPGKDIHRTVSVTLRANVDKNKIVSIVIWHRPD